MKITKQIKENRIFVTSYGEIYKEEEPDNFTGVYKEWLKNGNLRFEWFYKNGKNMDHQINDT